MKLNNIRLPALEEMCDKPLRVAAFCKTAPESGTWLQEVYYRTLISNYPIWTFFGCYGGQHDSEQTEHCLGGLPQMLAACKCEKIDLIVTKSPSTLKRNIVDCLHLIRELKELNPPVGIYFEENGLYTLSSISDVYLKAFLKFAEQESINKGNIVECNASLDANIPPSDS